MHPAYSLFSPAELTTSVVVASPHSGRHYPRSFLRSSMLDERSIRSSEDAFMDLLVEARRGWVRRCWRRNIRAPISTSTAAPRNSTPA
jgi:N-formylglutamate amidohydrolase